MAKSALKQQIKNLLREEIEALAEDDLNAVEEIETVEDDEETVEENTQLGGGSQNDTGMKLDGQIKGTVSSSNTKMEKGKDVAGDESDNQDAPTRMKRGAGVPKTRSASTSATGKDENQAFADSLNKPNAGSTPKKGYSEETEVDEEEEVISEEETLESEEQVREIVPLVTRDDIDVSDDLTALFGTDTEMSDEFKEKLQTVYEAAVISKVNEVLGTVIEVIKEENDAQLEADYNDMVDKVDEYLHLVVEQWREDNAVEIEKSINVQIAESFMEGLRELFEQHNIEVPEGKEDLIDQLVAEKDELEEQLNDVLNQLVEQNKVLEDDKKDRVLRTVSEGLSTNQSKKLKSLSESLVYESDEQFAEKLEELKGAYFTTKPVVSSIEDDETPLENLEEETVITDPGVRATSAVISRYFGKK